MNAESKMTNALKETRSWLFRWVWLALRNLKWVLERSARLAPTHPTSRGEYGQIARGGGFGEAPKCFRTGNGALLRGLTQEFPRNKRRAAECAVYQAT
jgi:hypothetical protein